MKKKSVINTQQVWEATQDILQAINEFSNQVDNRFINLENRFDNLEGRFDNLEQRVTGVEKKFPALVTKDYLDEKLMDLRGDLIVMMRKEDNKLITLVDKLEKKKVISLKDSQGIMKMEPFSKT